MLSVKAEQTLNSSFGFVFHKLFWGPFIQPRSVSSYLSVCSVKESLMALAVSSLLRVYMRLNSLPFSLT